MNGCLDDWRSVLVPQIKNATMLPHFFGIKPSQNLQLTIFGKIFQSSENRFHVLEAVNTFDAHSFTQHPTRAHVSRSLLPLCDLYRSASFWLSVPPRGRSVSPQPKLGQNGIFPDNIWSTRHLAGTHISEQQSRISQTPANSLCENTNGECRCIRPPWDEIATWTWTRRSTEWFSWWKIGRGDGKAKTDNCFGSFLMAQANSSNLALDVLRLLKTSSPVSSLQKTKSMVVAGEFDNWLNKAVMRFSMLLKYSCWWNADATASCRAVLHQQRVTAPGLELVSNVLSLIALWHGLAAPHHGGPICAKRRSCRRRLGGHARLDCKNFGGACSPISSHLLDVPISGLNIVIAFLEPHFSLSFDIKTTEKSFWASDELLTSFLQENPLKTRLTLPYFGDLGRNFKVTSCDVAIIWPDKWYISGIYCQLSDYISPTTY